MYVSLLGSGTSVPNAERAGPGLFLRASERGLLVDPSAGTTGRLARAGISLPEIAHILVTHFHPDHVGDLVPILFALRNPRYGSPPRYPSLHGPTGLREFYRGVRAPFAAWLPEEGSEITIHEGDGWDGTLEGIRVEAVPVEHTPESLALRFEGPDGEVVVFSGDSEECEALIELACDADLLFVECSTPRGASVRGHMGPEEVSRVVRGSNARRIVLVHLNPECDAVDLLGQIDGDVRELVERGTDQGQYEVRTSATS